MTPAPTRVPARALDKPRLRWALSGTVVLVLGTARGALWGLLLGEVSGQVALAFWTVPGVAMVLGWLVSGALVLAAALWVSPLAGDDVRRSIGWWAALVALDAIWRLVLVPMDLLWVEPYLGPAVGALAVCAVLASRRSPLRSYLGSALTAGLVLTLLTWTRGHRASASSSRAGTACLPSPSSTRRCSSRWPRGAWWVSGSGGSGGLR